MFKFFRGDTFAFKTKLILANSEIPKIGDIDTIFITCKEGESDGSKIVFQKNKEDIKFDEKGYIHVVFEPEDTENLIVGKYVFDIEVTLTNGYRKTKKGEFTLEYDVTDHKGE